MSQRLTEVGKKLATAIGGIVLSTIVAALIKGDKLSGLNALRRVLTWPVPFWSLLIAIGTAIFLATVASRKKLFGHGDKVPGLRAYHAKFSAYDYEQSMTGKDLLVVFNDGRSWFSNHREALERRVLRRNQRLRVLVLHPKSDFLRTVIRKADGRTLKEEQAYLKSTFQRVEELSQKAPGLVEIRGHFLFNPFILHLTETEALVHPFFLNERGELPIMVYHNDQNLDGLYAQYKSDAERAWENAKPLTAADFS